VKSNRYIKDKLENLDHTIQPILRQTQALTTRQYNVEATIHKVIDLMKFVDLANTPYEQIPNIEVDYKSYLGWLMNVHKGVEYFGINREYRKADQALHKLKDLLEEGIKECIKEFSRRLDKSVTQPYKVDNLLQKERWIRTKISPQARPEEKGEMSYFTHGDAVTEIRTQYEGDGEEREDFTEIIDDDLIARLGSIANFLYINDQREHLDKLVIERIAYLQTFLVLTIERRNINLFSIRSKEKDKETGQAERYVRGSHQMIFHMNLTLQLMEVESKFLYLLLREHGNVSAPDYVETVGKILEVPVDYMLKRCQKGAKDLTHQNPLIFLDILGEYNKLHKCFSRVLILEDTTKLEPAYRKMTGLQKALVRASGRSLIDYDQHVTKQRERVKHGLQLSHLPIKGKGKGLPGDGTVWHGSVTCMNFLLNGLMRYRDVLEHHCMAKCAELKEFNKYPANTTVGSIILSIVESLKMTLYEISKGYRNPSLSQIFLLNNFHFIQKRIRESDLIGNDIKVSGFIAKYQKLIETAQDNYSSHSWNRALEYVSISDSKKILSKCETKGGELIPDRWARAAIKSKFKEFNEKFAKQYEDQSTWSVPDADLRSQIRNQNTKRIFDAYKEFYETYRKVRFSRNMGKHIKYTPRNLKAMLESLLPD